MQSDMNILGTLVFLFFFFVRRKIQSLSVMEEILNLTLAARFHVFSTTHININTSQVANLLILYITDALLEIFEDH